MSKPYVSWEEVRDKTWPPGSAKRRDLDRHLDISRRTDHYLMAAFGWTQRIPIVGRLVYCFWTSLFEHDMEHYVSIRPREVLHPYGAIGFAFLNDGMRPSLWHTWMQLRHDSDRYCGIYIGRAPRNRAEADAIIDRPLTTES